MKYCAKTAFSFNPCLPTPPRCVLASLLLLLITLNSSGELGAQASPASAARRDSTSGQCLPCSCLCWGLVALRHLRVCVRVLQCFHLCAYVSACVLLRVGSNDGVTTTALVCPPPPFVQATPLSKPQWA